MTRALRVHWLQHADHEDLGEIAPWLAARGYAVTCTRLQRGERLPRPHAFDWLIAMGGPMNVDAHPAHPWLAAEKELIHDACVTNKLYLGMCLGAQLVARVLGGTVTRNPEPEIGWFDVELDKKADRYGLFAGFPNRLTPLHWHEDTFSIPPGADRLMWSEACANQAFVAAGGRVVGLQFHLEVGPQDLQRWLAEDAPAPQRRVQDAAEMLRDPLRFERTRPLLHGLLARLAAAD